MQDDAPSVERHGQALAGTLGVPDHADAAIAEVATWFGPQLVTSRGFAGPVYAVHPTEETILGHRALKRIEDLPADVDLAIIATGAERATEAAEACGKKGIPWLTMRCFGCWRKNRVPRYRRLKYG